MHVSVDIFPWNPALKEPFWNLVTQLVQASAAMSLLTASIAASGVICGVFEI